jgi:hypothetical protein
MTRYIEYSNIGRKDSVDRDEQVEECGNDRAEEGCGNHDTVRVDGEATKQRVAANNHKGAWRTWKDGETDDKEDEEGSGEEERMSGEEGGSPKGKKAAFREK